jgi:hypothetical protein
LSKERIRDQGLGIRDQEADWVTRRAMVGILRRSLSDPPQDDSATLMCRREEHVGGGLVAAAAVVEVEDEVVFGDEIAWREA